MNRNLWLTIALVLGAAAIWWAMLWDPASPDPEETVAETPATIEPAAAPTPPPSARADEPTAPAAPPDNAPSVEQPASPSAAQQAAPAPEEKIPAPERAGPVDELKAAFASEHRDSHATEPESVIQAAFRQPQMPDGLLKSVLCRASVCKVETRWTPERAAGFMGAFMHLVASPDGAPVRKFNPEIALSPEGAPDANGERAIDVYLKRIDSVP